jgi:hypothetical protein
LGAPFPLNDRYVRLDNETAYVTIADSISLSGGNRVHVTVDFFLESLPAAAPAHIAGKAATADFELTVSAAGLVSFVSRRTGGNATATSSASQALVPGRRYIVEGVDDGTSVKVCVNGVVGGTTAVPASGAIVADTNPTTIAGGGIGKFGLFAFQWVRDEILVCRLYVREETGAILHDTSDFGNDGAIVGVEDTTYMFGSNHLYEPVNPGGVTL